MTRPAEDLLDAIRILLRTFTVDETRFPAAEGRIKYNGIDFQSLHFIAQHPGCKGNELAAFLGVAATTAQSVCDRLLERGLIARGPHAVSRRAVAYSLTAQGKSTTAAIKRQDLSNCEQMLSALPARERKLFVAQILKIAQSVSADETV